MEKMKRKINNKALRILLCLAASLLILCSVAGCIDAPSYDTEETKKPQVTQGTLAIDTDRSPADTSVAADTGKPSDTQAPSGNLSNAKPTEISKAPKLDLSSVPEYSGKPYVAINGNTPFFTEADYTTASFELYSPLDSLGRCGTVISNVSTETMPTEERGSIGSVKPSGWQTVKYDIVDGKYLYNRCHLIGWQLTAENANRQNLITGTRYMNVSGMLPFENMIADYAKEERGNHVLYRVTPIFVGNELVARGVLMEAYSIEDSGEGISFCVYCYNVQPDIIINYANGTSRLADGTGTNTENNAGTSESATYTLNTNTKKFHYPDCSSAAKIADKNRASYTGTRDGIISQGYSPCGNCKP